jgi:hypothetical protein
MAVTIGFNKSLDRFTGGVTGGKLLVLLGTQILAIGARSTWRGVWLDGVMLA